MATSLNDARSAALPPHVIANAFSSAGDKVADFGPRRRMVRRKTIAPDAGFATFSTGIRAGWQAELQSRKFRQAVIAELIATAIFVAVLTAAVVFSEDVNVLQGTFTPNGVSVTTAGAPPAGSGVSITGNGTATSSYTVIMPYTLPRIVNIAVVAGLTISTLVFSTGSISGGNLNPAVTVALALTGKMSGLRATCYIAAQCVGATFGSAFVYSLAPTLFDSAGGAANAVAWRDGMVTTWTALGGEITGTAVLVTCVCAAADVGREAGNKYQGAMTPLMIGLAVLVAHLFLIPIDGCSINPARTFGSALVSRRWADHWIFWVGPLLGGPLAAILYEYVFKLSNDAPAPPTPAIIDVEGEAAGPGGLSLAGPGRSAASASSSDSGGGKSAPSPVAEGPANPFDAPAPALSSRHTRIMTMAAGARPALPGVSSVGTLAIPSPVGGIPGLAVAALPPLTVSSGMRDAYSATG